MGLGNIQWRDGYKHFAPMARDSDCKEFVMLKGTIATPMLIMILASQGFAASKSRIVGTVTDSEGAVIPHANITVHWDPSGSQVGLKDNIGIKQDASAVTDGNGTFSLDVPPGFYDIFISAMAFSPACLKVRVTSEKPGQFKMRLKVDPLVTKELGHEISN
jgi:hypothetical protein